MKEKEINNKGCSPCNNCDYMNYCKAVEEGWDVKGILPKNLSDTVIKMTSEDYKERFKAEYYQTKIRYDEVHKILIQNEAGTLNFQRKDIGLLEDQAYYMEHYLKVLEIRAEKEGIKL